MSRVVLPRSGLRERRRKQRIVVWCIYGAVALGVCGLGVASLWLPFVRISEVVVSGQKLITKDDILGVVQANIAGTYTFILPKNTIFIYPKNTIKKNLLQKFPIAESVTVHVKDFRTLMVEVTERQPVALWCGDNVASSSSCFLVDKGGVVFAPAVVYSGDAYQKYYGAVGGKTLPQQFLDAPTFRALTVFVEAVQKKVAVRVEAVVVDANKDMEVVFVGAFSLRVALHANHGDTFERLGLALLAEPFKARTVADFEYLDLRFGDRLYYKLKGQ